MTSITIEVEYPGNCETAECSGSVPLWKSFVSHRQIKKTLRFAITWNEIQGKEWFRMLPVILYEDDAIIVCVKQAGVATQTKRLGQPDMESMLKNYRAGKGEPPYIGVIHRLDQPVSGVMVFAKTKDVAASLSRQIVGKGTDKYYYAVTDGVPSPAGGTLEDYLLRDGKTNTSRVAGKTTPDAKKAVLSYKVLQKSSTKALVQIKLETGRHHQIRVQMAAAGYPLVGDRKYNFKENMNAYTQGLCLCSYRLAFRHPVTKKKMEFEIDNPFTLK